MVRGKYLPAGLHAAEASYVSSSSTSAIRAAIVRAVWSSKMPLANAPVILNLLDGPVGVDPAFHNIWSRFRMMRGYLAYNPEEEPRMGFSGALGGRAVVFAEALLVQSRFHLWGGSGSWSFSSSTSFCCLAGFCLGWCGERLGTCLPPSLRTMTCPVQHFRSAILDAWRSSIFAKLAEGMAFLGAEFSDSQGSLQLLTSSHLRERVKMLLRAILCGGVWNSFLLGKAEKKTFLVVFVAKRMVMVTFLGSALSPPSACSGSY